MIFIIFPQSNFSYHTWKYISNPETSPEASRFNLLKPFRWLSYLVVAFISSHVLININMFMCVFQYFIYLTVFIYMELETVLICVQLPIWKYIYYWSCGFFKIKISSKTCRCNSFKSFRELSCQHQLLHIHKLHRTISINTQMLSLYLYFCICWPVCIPKSPWFACSCESVYTCHNRYKAMGSAQLS